MNSWIDLRNPFPGSIFYVDLIVLNPYTMLFSKRCEYGLQAMIYLAGLQSPGYVSIREISARTGISSTFLTKILQILKEKGFVDSSRGQNGGVMLTQNPNTISLKDIIVAIDGPGLFESCVVGLPGCGHQKPCPLHEQWSITRACITDTFATTSIADLASPEHSDRPHSLLSSTITSALNSASYKDKIVL